MKVLLFFWLTPFGGVGSDRILFAEDWSFISVGGRFGLGLDLFRFSCEARFAVWCQLRVFFVCLFVRERNMKSKLLRFSIGAGFEVLRFQLRVIFVKEYKIWRVNWI